MRCHLGVFIDFISSMLAIATWKFGEIAVQKAGEILSLKVCKTDFILYKRINSLLNGLLLY